VKKAGGPRSFNTKIVLDDPCAGIVGQLRPPQKWPSQKLRGGDLRTCLWDSLSCVFVPPVALLPLWQLSYCTIFQMYILLPSTRSNLKPFFWTSAWVVRYFVVLVFLS